MGPFHRLLPGHARELAEIGGEGNGVHTGDEAIVLRHVADGPADERPLTADIVAEDLPFTLGRGQEAEEDAEERALSGAVRPEKAHGAAFELQAHAVEGGDRPIAEMEVS